ncbi:MAG: DNA (cytosine-5-)-methyltransferase [[Eubacterium] sulci]|nr:DNA (cytosine-5-)-methyltransferase [[Eubacterium] sulci]
MSKYTVVSLFSGAGGLDLGFHNAGFEIIWANDFDKYAVQTYRENFDNAIIYDDINNIDFKDIPDADVIIGGFPCQPFSMMGSELGFDDVRGTVFFTVADLIKRKIDKGAKPKVVVLENVRRLLTHDGGNTFKVIKHIMEKELGYKVFYKILNSSDFGVPQTRNRIFIVCFDNQDVEFTFPETIDLNCTMHDMLEENVNDKYFLSDKILKTILSNGTGKYNAKSEIDLEIARPLCSTMHKMHRACQDNYVTDRGRVRRLTPREAARLQGFPDDFLIPVSDTQAYRQFGNAVTVNVAEAVARSILEVLNEK